MRYLPLTLFAKFTKKECLTLHLFELRKLDVQLCLHTPPGWKRRCSKTDRKRLIRFHRQLKKSIRRTSDQLQSCN